MKTIGLRKQAQIEVKEGTLHATPPNMNRSKVEQSNQWSERSMTRIHFPGIPQSFICSLRWKYNATESKKGGLYLDVGHRRIRVNLKAEGAKLLLENHLVGKEGPTTSIDLDYNEKIQLVPEQWYQFLVEVKGDEVLIHAGDELLYGKHELISKHNAPSFNLDSGGAGFLVDEIQFFEVDGSHPEWETTKGSRLK